MNTQRFAVYTLRLARTKAKRQVSKNEREASNLRSLQDVIKKLIMNAYGCILTEIQDKYQLYRHFVDKNSQ